MNRDNVSPDYNNYRFHLLRDAKEKPPETERQF
jgi:uncharacterized short protein YbdD (DUF466 family)